MVSAGCSFMAAFTDICKISAAGGGGRLARLLEPRPLLPLGGWCPTDSMPSMTGGGGAIVLCAMRGAGTPDPMLTVAGAGTPISARVVVGGVGSCCFAVPVSETLDMISRAVGRVGGGN